MNTSQTRWLLRLHRILCLRQHTWHHRNFDPWPFNP